MMALAAVRAAYGCLQLARPDALAAHLASQPLDRPGRIVARVLGGRHLLQAAITGAAPTPTVARLGGVVDALHSASMVALAVVSATRRRTALTDAAVAGAFAAGGFVAAGRVKRGMDAGRR